MSTLLAGTAWSALSNPACNYKKFPIIAGGAKKETVNALNVDPVSNLIYVGGATESSNFAPAENSHGFVYAVSENGDWMWGQFFYNVSYAVSSIDGILMSQNNTFINCIG